MRPDVLLPRLWSLPTEQGPRLWFLRKHLFQGNQALREKSQRKGISIKRERLKALPPPHAAGRAGVWRVPSEYLYKELRVLVYFLWSPIPSPEFLVVTSSRAVQVKTDTQVPTCDRGWGAAYWGSGSPL